MTQPEIPNILSDQWDYNILKDGRIVYIKHFQSNSDSSLFQWVPPPESWIHFNTFIEQSGDAPLPYGFEVAYDADDNLYYLSHITKETMRDLPVGEDIVHCIKPSRKYKDVAISRHPLVGYGFLLSTDPPLFVSHVVPGGPADGKLFQGDFLYHLCGCDLRIQSNTCDILETLTTSLDAEVLQLSVIPKPKPRIGRPPPLPPIQKSRVRFNTPLSEIMTEEDGSFIRLHTATGYDHVLKVHSKLEFGDIILSLRDKLHLLCPVNYMGIIAIRLSNRVALPSSLLVCRSAFKSSEGWKFSLRILLLPQNWDELFMNCDSSLRYFYLQTCNDLASGYYTVDESSLAELLAIRIWFDYVRFHLGKSKRRKPSFRYIKKLGGFDMFLPNIWSERASPATKRDFFKKIFSQISVSNFPTGDVAIMLYFLNKCYQHISAFGGEFFHAQVKSLSKVTRICVSPSLCIAEECVKLDDFVNAPSFVKLVAFSELIEVIVTDFSVRDDLGKVRLMCLNNKDLQFIMRIYDALRLGRVLQFYYKQRIQNIDILKDSITPNISKNCNPLSSSEMLFQESISNKEYLNPHSLSQNFALPPYFGDHMVVPQPWSYFSDSFSQSEGLRHFSPVHFPLTHSKTTSIVASPNQCEESKYSEVLGDRVFTRSQSETNFTDSFDEYTDSESGEYTLEVPIQFLKESMEKVFHVMHDGTETSSIPTEVQDYVLDSNLIYSPSAEFIENVSISNSGILQEVEHLSIGIPPPPVFNSAEISLERLSTLATTLPSPTLSDECSDIFSPSNIRHLSRSTSDISLKARSDSVLNAHSWHSKYEQLYLRHKPSILQNYPENLLYQTTHVDAQPKSLQTSVSFSALSEPSRNRTGSTQQMFSVSDVFNEHYDNEASIQSENSLSLGNDSKIYLDDEIIILRTPPPIPISFDHQDSQFSSDFCAAESQFSSVGTKFANSPKSMQSHLINVQNLDIDVVHFSEPVASKRSIVQSSTPTSQLLVIPKAAPRTGKIHTYDRQSARDDITEQIEQFSTQYAELGPTPASITNPNNEIGHSFEKIPDHPQSILCSGKFIDKPKFDYLECEDSISMHNSGVFQPHIARYIPVSSTFRETPLACETTSTLSLISTNTFANDQVHNLNLIDEAYHNSKSDKLVQDSSEQRNINTLHVTGGCTQFANSDNTCLTESDLHEEPATKIQKVRQPSGLTTVLSETIQLLPSLPVRLEESKVSDFVQDLASDPDVLLTKETSSVVSIYSNTVSQDDAEIYKIPTSTGKLLQEQDTGYILPVNSEAPSGGSNLLCDHCPLSGNSQPSSFSAHPSSINEDIPETNSKNRFAEECGLIPPPLPSTEPPELIDIEFQ